MRLVFVLAPVALTAAAAVAVAACHEAEQYVYTAQRYDEANECLEDYAPIEMVSGSEVSSLCPATCFAVDTDVYVSRLCPPLPPNATEGDPSTSPCKEALAAAAKNVFCSSLDASEDDGGGGDEAGGDDDGGDAGADDGAAPEPDDASDSG
jgi:hypothetical protein